MVVAVDIHRLSANLPRTEDYALASQIRRSAVSVAANIAEGFGRGGNNEKCNFYRYSRGSAYETKSHLLYGVSVGYFSETEIAPIICTIDEIVHELNKIIKTLQR